MIQQSLENEKKKKQYLREWRDWDRFKCYPNNEDFETVKKEEKLQEKTS